MRGFLTINNYNPAESYWDLMIRGKKPRPITLEEAKEKYIEYAVFYLSDFGVYEGEILTEKPTWQKGESPKFLESSENTQTFRLSIEKVDPEKWKSSPYRLLYNDGDDSYRQKFFDSEEEALFIFNYIIHLPFNYTDTETLFEMLGMEDW